MKTKLIAKIADFNFKDGLLTISVQDLGFKVVIKDLVNKCREKKGGYIKCELGEPYKQRTLPMNARWWAMCTDYANYLGSTKEEVAEGIKWRAVDEGLWETEKIPCTNRVKPKSTAYSDTQELSILFSVLERVASEDGFLFDE